MKIKMNELLRRILETKRPTNNPAFCQGFTSGLLSQIPGVTQVTDLYRNVSVQIGESTMCFTAHQDTMDNRLGVNTLAITKDGIVSVKGGGILGADCGSGMYILLRMIKAGIPGLYVFFSQEEMGRVGSEQYRMPEHVTKCVSFDRAGTDNLITEQMGERGCSMDFAQAFIERFTLPFVCDPTGSFTDSYSFFEKVSECVNLSVGYYHQHSKSEVQDIVFLEKMVDACIAMDWETLPAERIPEVYSYSSFHSEGSSEELLRYIELNPQVILVLLEEYGVTMKDIYDLEDSMEVDKLWEKSPVMQMDMATGMGMDQDLIDFGKRVLMDNLDGSL